MATLTDIREKTGYSLSTISRVLSNDPNLKVPDETRFTIIKCANELGYKNKKGSRRRKIAIINWGDREMEVDDPIYFYMQVGANTHAKKNKIQTVIIYRDDALLNINDIDGIIAIGKFSERQMKLMSRYSDKIVFIDSNPDPNKYDSVQINYKKIVEGSIEAMLENGITNIGFIGGCEAIEDGTVYVDVQKKYFEEKMNQLNCLNSSIVSYNRFGLETGSSIVKKWDQVEKVPRGIICSSDRIAIGAISELISLGYKVPEQVQVIGCDNYRMSSYFKPSLSTVDIPFQKMGEMALDILIQRMEKDNSPFRVHYIETKLVSRESCRF